MRVATLLGPSLADLEAAITQLDPDATAFEVRLDTILEKVAPARLRALSSKPLIATCRRRTDGGAFTGTETERVALLADCLEAGFNFADVEGEMPLAAPEERLIRSRHELKGTPAGTMIAQWCQRIAAKGAIPKFAAATPSVHGVTQVLLAARILQRSRTRAAVMGLEGFPRALLPLLGVEIVYGGGETRPPGQPRLDEITKTLSHWGDPGPSSSLFLVLGDPVHHSRSPRMHNAAFRALGRDAAYGALPVRRVGDLQMLLEAGPRLALEGASITSPLKDAAYELSVDHGKDAEAAQAVNCLRLRGDSYRGENTDGPGAQTVLRRLLGGTSGSVLVLGTGGAGRAIAAARGGFDVTVAGRSNESLRRASRLLGLPGIPLAEAAQSLGRFDAVVNATASMEPVPLDGSRGALFDLHYATTPTPWEQWAQRNQRGFAGGLELLLEQGLLAFRIWTGEEPPRKAMEAALGLPS